MTLGNFIFNIVGVLEGVVLATVWSRVVRTESGVLRIDHSHPEKDMYRFEIDNLDNLSMKKHIVLKIDHTANLSQD